MLRLAILLLPLSAAAQDYRFPSSTEDYAFFYPTAYVDQGGHDWACGDIYYDGHRGTDLGGGSWAGMDAGRDVAAAADGTVIATEDGWFDECSTADCPGGGGFGNHIVVLHADGKATYYAHLKQGSVLVATGDTVACGQKIGEMGSSGHSTGPHLHFEVRIGSTAASPYGGGSSDPFFGDCAEPPSYWVSQGVHGGLPGLLCDGASGCAPSGSLQCGVATPASNSGASATWSQDTYSCSEFLGYSGGEIAWTWTAAVSESVTLSVTGLSADLDAFVRSGAGCGTDCFAGSTEGDSSDEVVTWDAVAGETYTVMIDGWEGANSEFVLTMACTPPEPPQETPGDEPADDDSATPADDDDSAVAPGPFLPGARRLDAPLGRGCGCSGLPGAGPSIGVVGIAAGLGLYRRLRRTKRTCRGLGKLSAADPG